MVALSSPLPTPVGAQPQQTCLGQPVTLVAEPGVVTVGTHGDDVILGTAGPDVIKGLAGYKVGQD